MSPRSLPPQSAPSPVESDLDSTAELPVLDAATGAAVQPAVEPHGSTGTWIMPSAAHAHVTPAADAGDTGSTAELQSLASRLEDAEQLLAGKSERLAQVERARDEALAARAAADERLATLTAQLAEQQTRAVALSAQLAEAQAHAAQHAAQLAEAGRARAAAEQRIAQAGEELGQVRALVSAAAEREAQLQSRLDEHQRLSREQLAQELRQRDAREAQGRARTANVIDELQLERARSTAYLESLQSVEARRLMAQELVTDLQREVDGREAELVRLEGELARRDTEVTERNSELSQRAARIGRLEQQLAAFSEQLAQRDALLRDARQEGQGLQTGFTRLQSELTAANERVKALEALTEQHAAADARAQGDLQRQQAEHDSLAGALEAARAAAAEHSRQASSQEAALASGRERIAQLEATLATEQGRVAQLQGELERLRGEMERLRGDMEQWGSALKSAQQERDGHLAAIAAADARSRELEQRVGLSSEEVRVLQMGSEAAVARVRELEADLRAAEEAVHRLESEARTRSARLEELEKANQHWRSVEEARHGATDTAANQLLREAAEPLSAAEAAPPAPDPAPDPAPAPDGTMRLLIQAEGGREIVHVLGRKTSIGRTPDNDLQIDAKFVSRHHAVILAGPAQTIVEDLNSTNGVQVNGRRVSRHVLRDGDQVAIGRTQYRFAVRKSGEKR